jgi:hypothetical protein
MMSFHERSAKNPELYWAYLLDMSDVEAGSSGMRCPHASPVEVPPENRTTSR